MQPQTIKRYTVKERAAVAIKLQRVVKRGVVTQTDVARGTGLEWQLVHRIVKGPSLPSRPYCAVLEAFLRAY